MKTLPKTISSALAAAILATAGIAVAQQKIVEPQHVVVDRVVAVVNDQIILLSELAASAGPYEERAAAEATDNIGRALARKQVREKIMNDMIADKLVDEQAKELGISVSEREIDGEVARIKKENNLDDAEFRDQMAKQGMEPSAFRDMLRKQKQRQKVIEVRVQPRVSISEAELRGYYAENFKNDDEVHVRMISKRIPQAATEGEVKRVKDHVADLRGAITTGGKDFGAVAKKETEGPNAENGGDLGWFKRGEIAAEIEQAAFALQPNEVSPVVELGGAFHILQVTERRAAPAKTYEEVSDRIRGILFSRAAEKEYDRWIQELRARSFVEVRMDGPVVAEESFATPTPRAPGATGPKKK